MGVIGPAVMTLISSEKRFKECGQDWLKPHKSFRNCDTDEYDAVSLAEYGRLAVGLDTHDPSSLPEEPCRAHRACTRRPIGWVSNQVAEMTTFGFCILDASIWILVRKHLEQEIMPLPSPSFFGFPNCFTSFVRFALSHGALACVHGYTSRGMGHARLLQASALLPAWSTWEVNDIRGNASN